MDDTGLQLNGKYWLLVDGKDKPVLVDGYEVIGAIAVRLPASYWPESDGPLARPEKI